jgi:hypothetical protein
VTQIMEPSSDVSSKSCAAFFATSTSASLLFKSPQNPRPLNPTKSMAGSSSIRLFHKVWVLKLVVPNGSPLS